MESRCETHAALNCCCWWWSCHQCPRSLQLRQTFFLSFFLQSKVNSLACALARKYAWKIKYLWPFLFNHSRPFHSIPSTCTCFWPFSHFVHCKCVGINYQLFGKARTSRGQKSMLLLHKVTPVFLVLPTRRGFACRLVIRRWFVVLAFFQSLPLARVRVATGNKPSGENREFGAVKAFVSLGLLKELKTNL